MIPIGCNLRRSATPLRRGEGQWGVTLVEMLLTILMSTMVFLSLTMLLSTAQAVRGSGENQSEAQRDASLVLGTMARIARQSRGYTISLSGSKITFTSSGACSPSFQGGPAFGVGGGQVQMSDGCSTPTTTLLIDGAWSRATQFQLTFVSASVVHAKVQVTYRGRQNELLETDLFLRNAG